MCKFDFKYFTNLYASSADLCTNERIKKSHLNSDANFHISQYKHRIIIKKYVEILWAVGCVSDSTTRRRRRFFKLEILDKLMPGWRLRKKILCRYLHRRRICLRHRLEMQRKCGVSVLVRQMSGRPYDTHCKTKRNFVNMYLCELSWRYRLGFPSIQRQIFVWSLWIREQSFWKNVAFDF